MTFAQLQFSCALTRIAANPDEMCGTIMEVLSADDVKGYTRSKKFREGQLPVETAMCDNFKGWGNFSNKALGIPSNVCFPHGTGRILYFYFSAPYS